MIGSYWEKGNQNEIDLLAINDLKKEITIADIKLDRGKIHLNALKAKAGGLLNTYSGYNVKWLGLRLEDVKDYLK